MTLNLLLTCQDAVYLSGDFRLTAIHDQSALPDSYDTQKMIPVIRRDWSALVAYAGLASAPPLLGDMGEWIAGQMDAIPFDGSFSELSRRLLASNSWLDKIRGDRRLAFSAVGFHNQRPFMMLLSNFLDTDGNTSDAGPQLKAYIRRSRQPEVRAVGTARPDVFERVKLERLLQAHAPRGLVPELTRQAIAETNARVARRSRGSITAECVSGCLRRTGSAAIGGHGIPEDRACLPSWVRRDFDKGGLVGFEPLKHSEKTSLPIQWKGMTVRNVNGTIVRTHEIANVGKPVLRESTAGERLLRLRDALRRDPDLVVLNDTGDDSICVVKYGA